MAGDGTAPVLTHTFFLYTLLTVGLGSIIRLVAPHPELLDRTDLVAANLGPVIDGQEHLAPCTISSVRLT